MFQHEKHLVDRVNVYRLDEAQDKFGGTENKLKLVASDVPARIFSKSGASATDEAGKRYKPTHKLVAQYDVNIEAFDKLEDQNGVKYRVVSRARRRIEDRYSHTECSLIQAGG